MLKFFRRRPRRDDENSIRRPAFIKDLSWPLLTKIRLTLNPHSGHLFFHHIVCMVAKMASIDGAVSEIELKVFTELLEREFALSRKQVRKARNILFEAHRSKKEFSVFAREFYLHFKNQPAVLENALDVLLAMAYSDSHFSLAEQRLMAEAAEIFHISSTELTRLVKRYHKKTSSIERPETKSKEQREKERRSADQYARHSHEQAQSEDERNEQGYGNQSNESKQTTYRRQWFDILGCTPFDPPEAIKKRYRALVLAYHPDTLPHGIPEEMKRASTERFIEIQKAYEQYVEGRV